MKRLLFLVGIIIITSCHNDDDSVPVFEVSDPQVIAELLPSLSQTNLFTGNLSELTLNTNAFKYDIVSPLFADYAHKLRAMALPQGQTMQYNGSGIPIFPNGTLITKTFYYNNNEQDLSQGKTIIETRILIKEDDSLIIGNYVWNDDQTDAILDNDEHIIPISWIDEQGTTKNTDYVVPNQNSCIMCHSNSGDIIFIGTKLRNLNFDINGVNQLQSFINNGILIGAPNVDTIEALPNWEDNLISLEDRGRAYFDINCAYCHSDGGMCEFGSNLRLEFKTAFNETNISESQTQISARMQTYSPGFSMPLIGTTMSHTEGIDLVQNYLNSLD